MTPSELKYAVEQAGNEPHFFTRSTMKFFGDSMSNYGVTSTVIHTNYDENGTFCANGAIRKVWKLYRRSPVKYGLISSAYFDKKTFTRVYRAF